MTSRFPWAILLLFLLQPALAEERQVVAVFELEAKGLGLEPAQRDRLTDYLCSLMAAEPRFQVVPRAQVKDRLRAATADSYRVCYDQGCQIEIGRELAAQKTLSAQVLRLGAQCKVSLTLYDLKRASSDGAANESGGCGEEALVASVERALATLLGRPLPPVTPRVELKLQGSAPGAVPKELRVEGSAVPTDIEPDLLVLYEDALARDKLGSKNGKEALDGWKAVAAFKKGKNPFRADAQKRVKEWERYLASQAAFERQHAQDRDKLKKLLGLKLMQLEQKVELFRSYMERYALSFGLAELEELLSAAAPEEATTLRGRLFSKPFFVELCGRGDQRACGEVSRIGREEAAAAAEADLQSRLARHLDEGWVAVEGVADPRDGKPRCGRHGPGHDSEVSAYFSPPFLIPKETGLPSNRFNKLEFKARCLGRHFLVLRPDGFATGQVQVSLTYPKYGFEGPAWGVPPARKGRQCAVRTWERSSAEYRQSDTASSGEYHPREREHAARMIKGRIDDMVKRLCVCARDRGILFEDATWRFTEVLQNCRVADWRVEVDEYRRNRGDADELGCEEYCAGLWGGDCTWFCSAYLKYRCAADVEALDLGECQPVGP